MKKSAFIAFVALSILPLLFSFNTVNDKAVDSAKKIIVKVTPVNNEKAIACKLYNLQERPTRVIIKDAQDRTFLSKKILHHNGFFRKFNLKNLNNGKYQLMILHPIESKFATLHIKNKSVEINWNE